MPQVIPAETLGHASTATPRVWGDYAAIFSAQVTFALLAAFSMALAARLLGPEGYGTVALFMGVVQCLFIVGVKWSFSAVIRFGREALIREGRAGRVVWAWVSLVGGSLVACALLFLAFPGTIRQFVGMPGGHPLLFIILLALTTWTMATISLLQMQGKMSLAAWMPVIGRVGLVALLVAWALCHGWTLSPVSVVLVSIGALAIQGIVGAVSLDRAVFVPVQTTPRLLYALTTYSLPLILASAGAYLLDWIDLYFLRLFRSYAELGIYQAAYQALIFVTGASIGLGTLAFPILTAWRTEGRHDRVIRYAGELLPQISWIWCIGLLVIALVQEPLLTFCFGPAFARSSLFFSVLLIGAAFHPVSYGYLALFFSHDMPAASTVVILLTAAVNILGDWWLVPQLGALGAALSTSASFAVSAWLYLQWGNRRIGVHRRAALVPPVVVAASLLAVLGRGVGVKIGGLTTGACVLIWWARAAHIFTTESVAWIDHVRMPRQVSWMIRRLYLGLSWQR